MNLTDRSRELFLAYAKDAGNWSGTPMIGGNVVGSKEDRGNITQLKRAGLIRTFRSEGNDFIEFTEAGKSYAREFGIEIRE